MAKKRKPMTWAKLFEIVASGAGQGHGDDYRPFLEVTRSRSSPCSNLGGKFLPGQARKFHSLSATEWSVALLLTFLGAEDVREQFPLWPMPHPHPLFGHPEYGTLDLPPTRGMLTIAEAADIVHGNFVGSDVPNVVTLDLMATIRKNGKPVVSLVSCKPRNLMEKARPSDRMPSRLMLEKLYADEIGVHFALADQKIFNTKFETNLKRFAPTRPTLREFYDQDDLLCQVEKNVNGAISQYTKREVEHRVASDVGLEVSRARRAIYLLIWRRRIDINLCEAPNESRPFPTGGAAINQELQRQLLGIA